jgi:hypothetical protein
MHPCPTSSPSSPVRLPTDCGRNERSESPILSCFALFFVQLAACSLQLAVHPVYESIASVSEVHGAWNLRFFRMCVKAYDEHNNIMGYVSHNNACHFQQIDVI